MTDISEVKKIECASQIAAGLLASGRVASGDAKYVAKSAVEILDEIIQAVEGAPVGV